MGTFCHPLLKSFHSPAWDNALARMNQGDSIALSGVPEGLALFLAASLTGIGGKRVLLILPSDLRAGKKGEDARTLLEDRGICLRGSELTLTRGAVSQEAAWQRLEALHQMGQSGPMLVVASIEAALQRMTPPDPFHQSTLTLRPGDQQDPEELIRRLVSMGYERVEMVEGKGQCALRGAIVDSYPPSSADAVRVEFFDDEVDSIRTFDCISQRSLEMQDEVTYSPATEVILPAEGRKAASDRMRTLVSMAMDQQEQLPPLLADLPPLPEDEEEEAIPRTPPKVQLPEAPSHAAADILRRLSYLMQEADLVESGHPFQRIRTWSHVLHETPSTLIDWARPDVVVLCAPESLRERTREHLNAYQEDLAHAISRGEAVKAQEGLLLTWEEWLAALSPRPVMAMVDMLLSLGGVKVSDAISLNGQATVGYLSKVRELAEDAKRFQQSGATVAILSGGVARGRRLSANMQEAGCPAQLEESPLTLRPGQVTILPLTMSSGFLWPDGQLILISDTEVFGTGYRKSKSAKRSGERISLFTDLKIGDYVVHEDHGVGIYQGTVRLQNDGTYRDYLLLQYQGVDRLYVPVEQLERVQRYIGNPKALPRLNHLGGGEWQKKKNKVREGLRTLAFNLANLYARRKDQRGYAFGPDTPFQRGFEDRFPYELTPDQAQAVQDITHDMESESNMDRLLCGDVGYGKTEVSLRAACKAVMDGKQVAILAPTTILAQQHYNTVKKRFDSFPVETEVISRFRTAREIKDVLSRVKAGTVDILVGTHRLLGKDVIFKDLGLLIVDEEQRFGVGHKEAIKHMKTQVDALTLSATPIPRTLHMSLVGIRDMSVLNTPPEERLPVQTQVVEYSDALVRDAILREVSRGGQVYFLYNQVRSIERFYARLRLLVPEVRIGVAHGQMKEHGLEDVMMDFYAGDYDVLLSTTIIENGLDVPTANTLIVFDADRLGLSQLYQLRGRVGRSSRQAYAYFTVQQDKILSEEAEQRLQAIREFTEFGSGFRIAMRDLEIRGAGNLFGPEQSGHLATVGYDMYCKLIEEALREVRGEKTTIDLETRVNLKVNAYLPVEYVADDKQRMEMYKRIAAIESRTEREDMGDHLTDRFGDPPPPTETLLDIALFRAVLNRLGVSQVTCTPGVLTMKLALEYAPDPEHLLSALMETDSRLALSSGQSPAILLKSQGLEDEDMLKLALPLMEKVSARIPAPHAQTETAPATAAT